MKLNKVLSTSNLYEPNIKKVFKLIDKYTDGTGNLLHGQPSKDLEKKLCKYHNSKYCVTFNSGFWALVASISIKSKKVFGEIIMPSLTYRRLADAVYWTNHKPVFVDIKENLSISPSAVRKNINKKTSLILAVHPIIDCCEVKELIKISKEYNVPIVFDCVESVHETFSGKRIGSFKTMEVFSLHASKLINGLEGGYVCINDETISKKLRLFSQGKKYGINSKINDFHAIFALASLSEIGKNISHNKKIYFEYKKLLSGISQVKLLEFNKKEQTSYKNILIEILHESKINRDDLLKILNKKNILARAYYNPPLHQKETSYPTKITNLEKTNIYSKKYLNLPCGFRTSKSDVKKICKLIKFEVDGE